MSQKGRKNRQELAVFSCYDEYMKESYFLGEEELGQLAEKVAGILSRKEKSDGSVILLEGDLGAGKTTFTKHLASALGIESDLVHSPTFILKKEYKSAHPHFKRLVHVDAYRFTHPNEAKVLRLEDDLRDPGTVVAIEWPSRMELLKSDMRISFRVEDEKTREITLEYEEDY